MSDDFKDDLDQRMLYNDRAKALGLASIYSLQYTNHTYHFATHRVL